jgi:hypothetical protein
MVRDWGPGDDGVEAVPRGPVGKGERNQLVVRVGSGERSLVNPIWFPPSVVPGRCNSQEPTLDPTLVSSVRRVSCSRLEDTEADLCLAGFRRRQEQRTNLLIEVSQGGIVSQQ